MAEWVHVWPLGGETITVFLGYLYMFGVYIMTFMVGLHAWLPLCNFHAPNSRPLPVHYWVWAGAWAAGHACTHKKSEDRGEDSKRTTDLRVYPHQQSVSAIISAVRAGVCPSECPVAQNYYTKAH